MANKRIRIVEARKRNVAKSTAACNLRNQSALPNGVTSHKRDESAESPRSKSEKVTAQRVVRPT